MESTVPSNKARYPDDRWRHFRWPNGVACLLKEVTQPQIQLLFLCSFTVDAVERFRNDGPKAQVEHRAAPGMGKPLGAWAGEGWDFASVGVLEFPPAVQLAVHLSGLTLVYDLNKHNISTTEPPEVSGWKDNILVVLWICSIKSSLLIRVLIFPQICFRVTNIYGAKMWWNVMTKLHHCGLVWPLFQISNVRHQMSGGLTSLLIDDCW